MKLHTRLVLTALGSALAVSAVAGATGPADLYRGGDLHESLGQADLKDLQAGVTYEASAFPLSVRLRPPDGRWAGAQFQSGRFRFIQLDHHRTGNVPLHGVGIITLESALGATPSVATTIQRLHSTPNVDAGTITPARVGGFSGEAFDATILGGDHPPWCRSHPSACSGPPGLSLVPFTTNHHCGFCTHTMHGETLDVKYAAKDQLLRIIVVNVRGKTVVVYVESNYHDQPNPKYLPSKVFPSFLPYAEQMLSALTFPGR